MSSIESGKLVLTQQPMDIRVLINHCSSIIDGQLVSRNLEFKKSYNKLQHPFVYGDELHLRQVFINILGNAVKFTPDGGTIEFRAVETLLDAAHVSYRFEFEDNGIGISEEFQSKIFDEFSQEENGSRSTYQGTGLGMAISKKLVDFMGGKISVSSTLGKGSCFTVEMAFEIDSSQQIEENTERPADFHGMKILLVEDNELNMEIATELLSAEGMVITPAENGKEALDLFEASAPGSFDAVLMDVMMPVMNGHEATKAIRKSLHPDAAKIPIIAMTANAYREDVQKAMEAGMNEHVAKPINMPLLLSVLQKYICA
jgi:CheY-like chemotaxis protein